MHLKINNRTIFRTLIISVLVIAVNNVGYGQHNSTVHLRDAELKNDSLHFAKNQGTAFAIKTNLLYNALLSPNIEAEISIKDKWSLSADWMFPWWVTKDNGNALQILAGNLEGRYWFGDRSKKPKLTGWFGGLYAGGGYYDLQYKNNGYQGEFFIAMGASLGYSHEINKKGSLLMEYSLGLGYLKTNYRYYEGREDNEHLVWQYDGNYTWLGPTKAKVALVWKLNSKKKR